MAGKGPVGQTGGKGRNAISLKNQKNISEMHPVTEMTGYFMSFIQGPGKGEGVRGVSNS